MERATDLRRELNRAVKLCENGCDSPKPLYVVSYAGIDRFHNMLKTLPRRYLYSVLSLVDLDDDAHVAKDCRRMIMSGRKQLMRWIENLNNFEGPASRAVHGIAGIAVRAVTARRVG
jgi:hypothetical protein